MFLSQITGLVIALPWSVTAATTTTDSAQHSKSRLTVVEIPLDSNEEALAKWCR